MTSAGNGAGDRADAAKPDGPTRTDGVVRAAGTGETGRSFEAAESAGSAGSAGPGETTGRAEVASRAGEAGRELSGQVVDLVGDLSEPRSPARTRRLVAATARAARRGGQVTWRGAHSAGRWLADQVIDIAPRLPVRDQARLRRQPWRYVDDLI